MASFAALLLSRNLVYLLALWVMQMRAPPQALSLGTVFLARGGCVVAVSLVAVAALRPVLRLDWSRYADALRYGFPLLLTTFIYALTDMTDRWFLAEFAGVVAVGTYALHLKVAAILSQAIVIPFGLWFPPERFKRLDAHDGGRRFFIRTAVGLAIICGYLSGAVWLARDLVLPLIAPGVVASPLVLACCLGAVTCLALSQALNVGLLLPGHTGKNALCTGYAVVASVVAASLLVPSFGAEGAAISRLLGGLVLVGTTAAWSHRIFPIRFPLLAMVLYAAISAATALGLDQGVAGRGPVRLVFALAGWTLMTGWCASLLWNKVRVAEAGLPANAAAT